MCVKYDLVSDAFIHFVRFIEILFHMHINIYVYFLVSTSPFIFNKCETVNDLCLVVYTVYKLLPRYNSLETGLK